MSQAKRILVVSAHPDDIEFACAGSVATWVDDGADVTYCIVTDGSTGTADPELAGAPLAEIRREESLQAAKIVGVDDVLFLGYRDGYVEPTLDLRRDIARIFRSVKPERMIVMDPASLPGAWFVNHPDHRAVGQTALDVTVTAGTTPGHFPELLEEGLEPWRGLHEIYVAGPGGGEFAVDITTGIDRKIEALRAHVSQVGEWDVAPMLRGWAKQNGSEHGYEYAELFHVLGTMEARRES
ncbi:MAG TPA: PIG-L deacetylase family protein [Actinomycetota bacterium]|nr:PIG-L deacetylase family protein [Actinomycetota bacterium]